MQTSPSSTWRFAPMLLLVVAAGLEPARADPMTLPAGMSVALVLQHHVNSGYTPAGSNVYFRVADDVVVGDYALIARNTLVVGKMAQASERGMVGRAGSMLVSVDDVPGVDGTPVRVDADLSKQGRSRGAATVGWTIFWGLPGLITKGVNPYMEKGDVLHAEVTSATTIDPAIAPATRPQRDLGAEFLVNQYRWHGDRPNGRKIFDIERKKDLKSIAFTIALPPDIADPAKILDSLRLYSVDGIMVPEELKPFPVEDSAAVFDAWSIARYCGNGRTSLLFTGTDPNGRTFHASRDLIVEIKKKHKS